MKGVVMENKLTFNLEDYICNGGHSNETLCELIRNIMLTNDIYFADIPSKPDELHHASIFEIGNTLQLGGIEVTVDNIMAELRVIAEEVISDFY